MSGEIKMTPSSGSDFKFEDGRRYHGDENAPYLLPNDTQEADRILKQHWMLRYAFKGNYEAPLDQALKNGLTVLDAGCGPGAWTLELAEAYPQSQFHGVDISAVFPDKIKLPNLIFHTANLTQGLPFPDDHFDYIHQRLLVAGLPESDYEKVLTELLRVLKPGGWLEIKEIVLEMDNAGSICTIFNQTMANVMKMRGLNPKIALTLPKSFEEKGLVNIKERVISIPLNHGGQLGQLFWDDMKETLRAFKPVFAKLHPEQYGDEKVFYELVEKCGQECAERKIVGDWHVIIGQKPE